MGRKDKMSLISQITLPERLGNIYVNEYVLLAFQKGGHVFLSVKGSNSDPNELIPENVLIELTEEVRPGESGVHAFARLALVARRQGQLKGITDPGFWRELDRLDPSGSQYLMVQ
jgi:hypothetical protein